MATPTRFGMRRSDSSIFSATPPPPRMPTPKDLAGKSSVDIHARVQANFSAADGYRSLRRRCASPFGTTAPAAVGALIKLDASTPTTVSFSAATTDCLDSGLGAHGGLSHIDSTASLQLNTKAIERGHGSAFGAATARASPGGSGRRQFVHNQHASATTRDIVANKFAHANSPTPSAGKARTPLAAQATPFRFVGRDPRTTTGSAADGAHNPLLDDDHDGSTPFRPSIRVLPRSESAASLAAIGHSPATFRPIGTRAIFTPTAAGTPTGVGFGFALPRHPSGETVEPEFRTALKLVDGQHSAIETDRSHDRQRLRTLVSLPWHHAHPTDPILGLDAAAGAPPPPPATTTGASPSPAPSPSESMFDDAESTGASSSSPDASPRASPVPYEQTPAFASSSSSSSAAGSSSGAAVLMRTASAPSFFTPATPSANAVWRPMPQQPQPQPQQQQQVSQAPPPRLIIDGETPAPRATAVSPSAAAAAKTYAGIAAAHRQHAQQQQQQSAAKIVTSTGFAVAAGAPNVRGVRPQSVRTYQNSDTFRTTYEQTPAEPPRPRRRMYADSIAALDLASPAGRRAAMVHPPPASLVSTSRVAHIAAASPVSASGHGELTFEPIRAAGKPSGAPLNANFDFVFFQPCASPEPPAEVLATPKAFTPAAAASSSPLSPTSGTYLNPAHFDDAAVRVYPRQPLTPQPRRLKKTPSWLPHHSPDVIRNEYARGSAPAERHTRDTRKERQAMVARLMAAAPSTYFAAQATAGAMKTLMSEARPWLVQHPPSARKLGQ